MKQSKGFGIQALICLIISCIVSGLVWYLVPAAQNIGVILPAGIVIFLVLCIAARVLFGGKDKKPERPESEKLHVTLESEDYPKTAAIILEGLGGKDNVDSIDNCATRLRLTVADYGKVDEKKIRSAGVTGVIRPSKNAVQIIIGAKTQAVADEVRKLL